MREREQAQVDGHAQRAKAGDGKQQHTRGRQRGSTTTKQERKDTRVSVRQERTPIACYLDEQRVVRRLVEHDAHSA
jgi:hypothetical protein